MNKAIAIRLSLWLIAGIFYAMSLIHLIFAVVGFIIITFYIGYEITHGDDINETKRKNP